MSQATIQADSRGLEFPLKVRWNQGISFGSISATARQHSESADKTIATYRKDVSMFTASADVAETVKISPELLRRFLLRISSGDFSERLISSELAGRALATWGSILADTGGRMPTPSATPGEEGDLTFSWSTLGHYMELEFFDGRPTEFFYKNKGNGELVDLEYDESQPIPDIIIQKINLFV
jgi:hypothetical protein